MKILLIATNRHGRYMNDIQAQPLPIGLDYIVGLHRWLTSPDTWTVNNTAQRCWISFADDCIGDV